MNKNKDILIIGFALFSMFFGAGNLIFPPYIGLTSGNAWFISFIGFILADVGIILLSITAIAKAGSLQGVIGRVGKKFGISLEVIMMLCLGPILVIPRTAATTFEMSVMPLFNGINPVIFSIGFFALTLLLTIRPTKVIDIIGKFLTPVLLISLALLIIKGIISPIGDINTNISSNDLFVNGITQGYQTMDALGLGGIVALLMTSFITKGYSDKKEVISLTIKASLVAGSGLTVVYGGLTYLGATASNLFDTNISQTTLLINITNALLGNTGIAILGVIVAFACLTTAIGLTSVTGKYFEDVTNKKLKYEHIVIFICGFSAIVSNFGVDKIIQIAAPILTVIYPVTIVLVVMSCLRKIFVKDCTFRGAAYATLLVSLLTVIDSLGISIGIVNKLPLAQFGFNWVVPAIIGGALFTICSKKDNMIKSNNINKAS